MEGEGESVTSNRLYVGIQNSEIYSKLTIQSYCKSSTKIKTLPDRITEGKNKLEISV